jgi:septum formation protein
MTDLAHPLWIEPWPLVLASASPSRAAMLRAAGIPIEIVPAEIDERALETEFAAQDAGSLAVHLAAAKAQAVSLNFPNRLVLGADQTLTVGSERLHKPSGLADARSQLLKLRDREHILTSAAALTMDGSVLETFASSATLYMRPFSEEFLDRYLGHAGNAVMTSVGGYQLEGAGVHLFNDLAVDHFTVLGLPLLQIMGALRARGMLLE